MTLLFFFGYLVAIAWVGSRATEERLPGTEDYVLAGRRLTLPMFTASLVTSFYGGVLGIGESTYRFGVSNWLIQGVPYYVFALLYAWLIVPRLRARKGLTMPDQLEAAYGRPMALLAAALVFILASPADEILMLSVIARWLTGWAMPACAVLMTAAAILFLFKGGFRAHAWTSRLEFLVMFGGFALLLPFAWRMTEGLAASLPPHHLSPTGGRSIAYLASWFLIALWTFVDPGFHQRTLAAKDSRTARKGIALAVVFWCLFDFMTTSAGLMARSFLPGLEDPLLAFPALAESVLPSALTGIFFAGLASSTLAALSSTSFLAAVSAARDGLGRWKRIPAEDEERWIQAGLGATALLGLALALALPSVVGLWYIVGSTTIPGLLLPVLGVYFEPLRLSPRWAVACSLAGWGASLLGWLAGVEMPFYPGLFASAGVWALGKRLPA